MNASGYWQCSFSILFVDSSSKLGTSVFYMILVLDSFVSFFFCSFVLCIIYPVAHVM